MQAEQKRKESKLSVVFDFIFSGSIIIAILVLIYSSLFTGSWWIGLIFMILYSRFYKKCNDQIIWVMIFGTAFLILGALFFG